MKTTDSLLLRYNSSLFLSSECKHYKKNQQFFVFVLIPLWINSFVLFRKSANILLLINVDELATYTDPFNNIAVISDTKFYHYILLMAHSFPFSDHKYSDFLTR